MINIEHHNNYNDFKSLDVLTSIALDEAIKIHRDYNLILFPTMYGTLAYHHRKLNHLDLSLQLTLTGIDYCISMKTFHNLYFLYYNACQVMVMNGSQKRATQYALKSLSSLNALNNETLFDKYKESILVDFKNHQFNPSLIKLISKCNYASL
jgi:hypothetical protein